ncbi:riboflavin synthase [Cyclobacteriaceae bacterium]|jgi:riboflavin synthase|nr:riboflavin synthase [Cyclobacteriaceae bacterium]MDA9906314.1 riboflavin synthase [Cyclobacteriaceae bacterium]MDB9939577.1 riboflavin synthase [Cyclobacteriaceae bacterium]|tara:strand:- start:6 stop:596 length:591 start_codon:yes stop_codon:yes gene_type:complete
MFTGIVEVQGKVSEIVKKERNFNFCISSTLSSGLKVDQSIAHNGVCLTVTAVEGDKHWVTVIDESMQKTNLETLNIGDSVNLERCMIANGRFDGHVVQGHVDKTARILSIEDAQGSWLFTFIFDDPNNLMVEKGSVTINGISLTCFNVSENQFQVAIIPYTYEHTNLGVLKGGDRVNIEFDIIGKYVEKILSKRIS